MSEEDIYIEDIYCRSCKRITSHEIDRKKSINDVYGEDYTFIPTSGRIYEIVVCRGCNTKSFRITKYRQKGHHELSPDEDIFIYECELFPKSILWHNSDLKDSSKYIPPNIYQL